MPASKLKALSHFIQTNQLPCGIAINQSNLPQWLTPTIFQLPVGSL